MNVGFFMCHLHQSMIKQLSVLYTESNVLWLLIIICRLYRKLTKVWVDSWKNGSTIDSPYFLNHIKTIVSKDLSKSDWYFPNIGQELLSSVGCRLCRSSLVCLIRVGIFWSSNLQYLSIIDSTTSKIICWNPATELDISTEQEHINWTRTYLPNFGFFCFLNCR